MKNFDDFLAHLDKASLIKETAKIVRDGLSTPAGVSFETLAPALVAATTRHSLRLLQAYHKWLFE